MSDLKWYDWNSEGEIPGGVKQVCFADSWTVDFMEFMEDPSFWEQKQESTDIIAYTLGEPLEGG